MITVMAAEDLQAYAEKLRRFEDNYKLSLLGFKILDDISHHKRCENNLSDFEKRALIKALDTSIFLLNAALLVKQV